MTDLKKLDYITADIEGNVREKRRKLKKGALWAVGIVSLLYISFNLFFVSGGPKF